MIRGKKINFFIGYLNEDVFILLNTCNYMGLFVKVSPKGDKTIGWRQVSDEDIEDYRNGEIVELYNFSGGRCFSAVRLHRYIHGAAAGLLYKGQGQRSP